MQARVFELAHRSLYRTLRGAHANCLGCSTFVPHLHHGAGVATGGLDGTVVTWDAATGKRHMSWDLNADVAPSESSAGMVNPPMAHAMAVCARHGKPTLCAPCNAS
jgi:WD40 repeat protein